MYSNQETKGQVTVENTLTVPSCVDQGRSQRSDPFDSGPQVIRKTHILSACRRMRRRPASQCFWKWSLTHREQVARMTAEATITNRTKAPMVNSRSL